MSSLQAPLKLGAELGYRHLIFYYPAPRDVETITRITAEVRPKLETLSSA